MRWAVVLVIILLAIGAVWLISGGPAPESGGW